MRTRRFSYPTMEQAEAFVEGVEWVNDSAIQAEIEKAGPDEFVVVTRDSDHTEEDEEEGDEPDPPPECGHLTSTPSSEGKAVP